jgi:TPR repeat protein
VDKRAAHHDSIVCHLIRYAQVFLAKAFLPKSVPHCEFVKSNRHALAYGVAEELTMKRTVFSLVLAAMLVSDVALGVEPEIKNSVGVGAELFQRGWKYDQGIGTPINTPAAIRFYQQAADLGNPLAKGRLARFYFNGNCVQRDQRQAEKLATEAFPQLLEAAKQNNAVAQMIVGTMCAQGLGTARDSDGAFRWLRKAANQKLALAQANLGVMYENGWGVPIDPVEAAKWYSQAAGQNSAMGQAYLGLLYYEGRGVPCDKVEAERLFRLSAQQNFPEAETNLGYMYEHGCIVGRDPCEAVRLYRLAAQQNLAVAQTNLGTMYQKGCGVAGDLNEAMKWYQLAADQGDANAREALRCLTCEPVFYCCPRTRWWCW